MLAFNFAFSSSRTRLFHIQNIFSITQFLLLHSHFSYEQHLDHHRAMTSSKRKGVPISSCGGAGIEEDERAQKVARLVVQHGRVDATALTVYQMALTKTEFGMLDEADHYIENALYIFEQSTLPTTKFGLWTESGPQPDSSRSSNAAHLLYAKGLSLYDDDLLLSSNEVENDEGLTLARIAYNIGLTYISRCNFHAAKGWFDFALTRIFRFRKQCGGHNGFSDQNQSQQVSRTQSEVDPTFTKKKIIYNMGYCCFCLAPRDEATTHQNAYWLAMNGDFNLLYIATANHAVDVLLYYQKDDVSPPDAFNIQAVQLFQECRLSFQKDFVVNSKEFATMINNIGRRYYRSSDCIPAIPSFRGALHIRRHSLKTRVLDFEAIIYNLGQVLHKGGFVPETLTCHSEFLILEEIFGALAKTLERIGDIYREAGRPQHALAMYKKSFEAFLRASEDCLDEQSILLSKLGFTSYELDFLYEALNYFSTGLRIALTIWDVNHPHILISLRNLAQIHRRLGDFPTAITMYSHVYAIHAEIHGRDCLQAAVTLSSLGHLRFLQHNFDAALELFQETLRIQRLHFGEQDLFAL